MNVINVKKKGEITVEMVYQFNSKDSKLGKRVVKLAGLLSASNYLEIPNKEYTKSLNYSGKYYYIYFRGFSDKKFTIQMVYMCNDIPIRFNLKYPLNEPKVEVYNIVFKNKFL